MTCWPSTGPRFHARFTNTYIVLPEGPLVLFWPESPHWYQEAESDFTLPHAEFITLSLPANNPARRRRWCAASSRIPSTGSWMVSVSTPLDMDGRHVATISHDVLLKELMDRTINERLPGAYNILFRDDGQLIAHPELDLEGAAGSYNLLQPNAPVARGPTRSAHRRSAPTCRHLRAGDAPPSRAGVLELPSTTIPRRGAAKGPGWNFVTVLPGAR